MSAVFENISKRRSVREFSDKSIPKQDIEKLVEAGLLAPSGRNLQSWQFTVLQDKQSIQKLAAAVRKELGRDESYNFYDPTALIILSNDRDNSNGLADCACALENIFLMASDLGIGSVWINQLKGICDSTDIRNALNEFKIPEDHVVWGMAALGYAKEGISLKEKKITGKVVYI